MGRPKKRLLKQTKTSKAEYDYYEMDNDVYFMLKGRGTKEKIFTRVSKCKWPLVLKHDWHLNISGYAWCYALCQPLHRYVYYLTLGFYPPSNLYVDHMDRDKLNNSDGNLRLSTPQQNSFNKSSKTNLKGVRGKTPGKYSASITKDGKTYKISNISTETLAAQMYNYMATDLFGEYAALNIIPEIEVEPLVETIYNNSIIMPTETAIDTNLVPLVTVPISVPIPIPIPVSPVPQ